MPLSDRILMGPGPCNPYPEAVEALGRPMLGHLDPDFIALLDETNDRLRTVFGTSNPLTFPVSDKIGDVSARKVGRGTVRANGEPKCYSVL